MREAGKTEDEWTSIHMQVVVSQTSGNYHAQIRTGCKILRRSATVVSVVLYLYSIILT